MDHKVLNIEYACLNDLSINMLLLLFLLQWLHMEQRRTKREEKSTPREQQGDSKRVLVRIQTRHVQTPYWKNSYILSHTVCCELPYKSLQADKELFNSISKTALGAHKISLLWLHVLCYHVVWLHAGIRCFLLRLPTEYRDEALNSTDNVYHIYKQ